MKRLDKLRIAGGTPLHGTIRIQGSKNAALPMMAAALLYPGISVLRNCPRIADVFCMEEILGTLGVDTRWQEHDLYLDCTKVQKTEISAFYTEKMRSSVILLGVLLGRVGRVSMGYPGGCVIGKRPVDLHLYALRKFGAKVEECTEAGSGMRKASWNGDFFRRKKCRGNGAGCFDSSFCQWKNKNL